jgi:hypothetical protein
MVEKGKHPTRRSERANTNIVIHFSDGERMYTENLCDISMGGLQIETMRRLESNTELTLSLPSDPPVKVKGIVRWARKEGLKYRIGIQFTAPTIEQEYRIRELTQSLFWELSHT